MMRAGKGAAVFEHEFGAAINSNTAIADFEEESLKRAAWGDVIDAADPSQRTLLVYFADRLGVDVDARRQQPPSRGLHA